MDPTKIRFIQDSIDKNFQFRRSVEVTRNELQNLKISPHWIPPMRVFEWNNNICTEDNRGLRAFQETKLGRVPVQFTSRDLVDNRNFTTKNKGRSVVMRK